MGAFNMRDKILEFNQMKLKITAKAYQYVTFYCGDEEVQMNSEKDIEIKELKGISQQELQERIQHFKIDSAQQAFSMGPGMTKFSIKDALPGRRVVLLHYKRQFIFKTDMGTGKETESVF